MLTVQPPGPRPVSRPLWLHSLRPLNQAEPPEPLRLERQWTRADALVVVAFGIAVSVFAVAFAVAVVTFLSWQR